MRTLRVELEQVVKKISGGEKTCLFRSDESFTTSFLSFFSVVLFTDRVSTRSDFLQQRDFFLVRVDKRQENFEKSLKMQLWLV